MKLFKSKQFASFGMAMLVIVVTLNLLQANEAEALKLKKKEKKALKSLVKGLIFKNLSTKKNILPLPVPIPGKWQSILNSIVSNSGGRVNKHRSRYLANLNQNKRLSTANGSAATTSISNQQQQSATLSLLMATLFQNSDKLLKRFNPQKVDTQSAGASAAELDNIKKLTRQAAAKYARKIISNQTPKSSGQGAKKIPIDLVQALSKATHRKSLATSESSATMTGTMNRSSSKNDYLVTFFNLVKLVRQIKELDHTKLVNVNKKSSIFFNQKSSSQTAPIISMNINNRKSLMNKMNYIHKLTTGLNHRNRLF